MPPDARDVVAVRLAKATVDELESLRLPNEPLDALLWRLVQTAHAAARQSWFDDLDEAYLDGALQARLEEVGASP